MKILIIANAFPPLNTIASLRPYSWAKYWSRAGHEITVLTTYKAKTASDLELDYSFCKVIEVDYMKAHPWLSKRIRPSESLTDEYYTAKNVSQKKDSLLKVILKKILHNTGVYLADCRYPNIYQLWVKEAIQRVKKEEVIYDVAVATYAPFATLQIANQLKKQGLSKQVVFDFRDLWVDSPFKGLFPFRLYEKRLERKLCMNADVITIVSEPLAQTLRNKFNRAVSVILNGFDTDDLGSQPQEHLQDTRNRNILYTGTIYEGFRDPSPLFQAIEELKNEQYEGLSKLSVTFLGRTGSAIEKLLETYDVRDYVENKGYCKREVVLSLQQTADVLLFLDHNGENSEGILTGKLFEYLFSGTYIWSVGGINDASRIIESNKLGQIFGKDVHSIKKSIKALIENGVPTIAKKDLLTKFRIYTREYQAQKMLELF